jgi:protoheme IX farnesyltransferase
MKTPVPKQTILAIWCNYAGLTKPRVVLLLLLTTVAAMWLASGGELNWTVTSWTVLGGYLSAGGAGALNCYFDRDMDGRMTRTCRRAVPAGRVAPHRALLFGLALAVLSFIVLWLGTNALAALLGLAGLLHYVIVYTWWLKRRTTHNIVIGGLAGAIAPLVGWAAATGGLEPMVWLLAGIVLAWTPPHFWALALLRSQEYASAGVPMLPVVRGGPATRRAIFAWTALTVALSFLPLAAPIWSGTAAAPFNVAYCIAALVLGGVFLGGAWWVVECDKQVVVRRFYFFTIFYLAALFLLMALALNP